MIVIRSLAFKLRLPEGGSASLKKTMQAYTTAFSISALWGFENQTWNKVENHKATYRCVRETVPELPSSLVQCARDCACEALKAVKCSTLPERKPYSALRYNQRVIRVCPESGYATVATVDGRITVTFTIPDHYRQFLRGQVRSSTLTYRKQAGVFYLHAQIEIPTPSLVKEQRVLGIDRGIVNVAVCSDNTFFNSKSVKNVRGKCAFLRARLQSKGTRSARRKLRELSGRERRFVTDVNHCISKQIVNSDYSVFALEDLSKIRVQNRRGKTFNRMLNSWSFYELEQFIRYKAESLGKSVVLVDSRYSSQKCSRCGHTYKGNRSGSDFRCRSCGFHIHADLNASRNIAQAGISCLGRLPVNQPIVACL